MKLLCEGQWWCLAAMLVCLNGASSTAPDIRGAVRAIMKEAVVEALQEQAPGRRCSCPDAFTPCGGLCYARLHRAVTHRQAQFDCAALGAHLAVPRSPGQNLCVAGLAGHKSIWLGVDDREREGVFMGADGSRVTAAGGQVWAEGQPDNAWSSEDCVEIRAVSWGYRFAEWNDYYCTKTNYPMCQLK